LQARSGLDTVHPVEGDPEPGGECQQGADFERRSCRQPRHRAAAEQLLAQPEQRGQRECPQSGCGQGLEPDVRCTAASDGGQSLEAGLCRPEIRPEQRPEQRGDRHLQAK
jgi:hypothetical protein